MLRQLKKRLIGLCLLPGMALADSNPFDVMGIQDDIDSNGDIVSWFKNVLTSEYFPLVLGAIGVLIFVACGAHVYAGLKKARTEEGASGVITEHFTIPIVGCVVGVALIGLAWSINTSVGAA